MKLFLSSCTHSQGRSTVARISTFVKGIKCCKCGAGCLISPCTVLIHLSPRSFAFLPWVVLEKRGAVGVVGVILVFRWSLSAMTFHMSQTHGENPPVLMIPHSKEGFRGLPNCCAEVNIQLWKQSTNAAAAFEGQQCRRACTCGTMPSSWSWLRQESTEIYAGPLAC